MTLFSQDDHLTAGAWAASATSDTFLHQTFKEALQGFLTAVDLGAYIARALKVSTCKTNMAAQHDRTIII